MKAYHFLKENMKSGEGREKAWVIGEEREIKGKLTICERGYHSSPSWYDALQYAPGSMACIVEVSEPVEKDDDKQVSHKRKLIDARDTEKTLRTFACDCAERALKKAKVKDKRSWNAVKVARLFYEGKATKQELDAARDAARVAARDAAWDAARDAAWAAAWDAARDAAGVAAWDAAWDAARDAAWAAAGVAAWVAARDAAWAAARDAAWDAARDAAWAAEEKWQRKHLDKLMKE